MFGQPLLLVTIIVIVAILSLSTFVMKRSRSRGCAPLQMPPGDPDPVWLSAAAGDRAAPGRSGDRERWVLVLDLDETMGHLVLSRTEGEPAVFVLRPYLRDFLACMSRSFDEVVVFTAGTRDYAEPIINSFDPVVGPNGRKLLNRRYYRDMCTPMPDGTFAKDLRLLGEQDLARVLLLDNSPSSYALQPQCGVPIESFYGSKDDIALLHAIPTLLHRLEMKRDTA